MAEPKPSNAGRICTVCSHPELGAIEMAILTGADSERAIASRWGIPRANLQRHAKNHMSKVALAARDELDARATAQIQATAAHGAQQVRGAILRIEGVLAPVLEALETVRKLAKDRTDLDEIIKVTDALGRLSKVAHDQLKTLGQASGEIPMAATQVNVLVQSDAFKEAQQSVKNDVARFFAWVGEWAPDDKAEWVRRAIAALQTGTLDEWERDVRAVTVKGGGE